MNWVLGVAFLDRDIDHDISKSDIVFYFVVRTASFIYYPAILTLKSSASSQVGPLLAFPVLYVVSFHYHGDNISCRQMDGNLRLAPGPAYSLPVIFGCCNLGLVSPSTLLTCFQTNVYRPGDSTWFCSCNAFSFSCFEAS